MPDWLAKLSVNIEMSESDPSYSIAFHATVRWTRNESSGPKLGDPCCMSNSKSANVARFSFAKKCPLLISRNGHVACRFISNILSCQ